METSMEYDFDGKRLQWKTTSMENNFNGRQLNRRQPHVKATSIEEDQMEDDLNGRLPLWKTTSRKDSLNGRQPKWKTMEDNLNGIRT